MKVTICGRAKGANHHLETLNHSIRIKVSKNQTQTMEDAKMHKRIIIKTQNK
jgi:hypothetical protein